MNKSAPPTAALPIADCLWCDPRLVIVAPRVNTADGTMYWVFCPDCGMHGPAGTSEQVAVARWNFVSGRAPAVQATADADVSDCKCSACAPGQDIPGLLLALSDQKQCDEDGVMCEVSRQAVDEAIAIIRKAVSPKAAADGPRDIKRLVDRFLGWKLPENFSPDAGISFKKTFNDHFPVPMKHEPTGTNLFDASQAEAMLRYVLEIPAAVSGDKQEKERG